MIGVAVGIPTRSFEFVLGFDSALGFVVIFGA